MRWLNDAQGQLAQVPRPMAFPGIVAAILLLLRARHAIATQTADANAGYLTGWSAEASGFGLGLLGLFLFVVCSAAFLRKGKSEAY